MSHVIPIVWQKVVGDQTQKMYDRSISLRKICMKLKCSKLSLQMLMSSSFHLFFPSVSVLKKNLNTPIYFFISTLIESAEWDYFTPCRNIKHFWHFVRDPNYVGIFPVRMSLIFTDFPTGSGFQPSAVLEICKYQRQKFQCSSDLPCAKYNCVRVVLFLRQMYWLFMLQNMFPHRPPW